MPLNLAHSVPQTKPPFFQESRGPVVAAELCAAICWSRNRVRFSTFPTQQSQFLNTVGPSSLSSSSRSTPLCSSRIRFAICFDVAGSRSSSGVNGSALKYCSKRPLVKVPKSLGPMRFLARRFNIPSSMSRSMRFSTFGP